MSRIALLIGCTCLALVFSRMAPAADEDRAQKYRVYVGTYSGGASKGIYLLELDVADGSLSPPLLAAEAVNPSFLAVHPSRRFLYAVGEIDSFGGRRSGAVTSFSVDGSSGTLRQLNQQPSGGVGPCYVTVDRAGKNVLVANYGSGSVACLPVDAGGRLAPASSTLQHEGPVADPKRQGGPHAHSINLDAANRFAIAADLGLDKLFIDRFVVEKGTLTPGDPPFARVAMRSGPRHFAFHPDGRHGYAINEISCTVSAFDYDPERGVLSEIQTASTLPEGTTVGKELSTAEVQVHPSGRFLYGSNRGHDTIAIFAIDATGRLRAVGHQPTQGKTPRNFGIDPTGRYLLAANQDSGSVVVFRIDGETGRLEPTGQVAEVPKPVCVKFVMIGD